VVLENIGLRSWECGLSAARSAQKKDREPTFSWYGPEQSWLIGDLLHNWKYLIENNATIANWKNITNFKSIILIRSRPGIYSHSMLNKTEGKESWNLKERNLSLTWELVLFTLWIFLSVHSKAMQYILCKYKGGKSPIKLHISQNFHQISLWIVFPSWFVWQIMPL